MQQAWEYEKEGMGLQYNYGQQAADAEYKRNLQMWKDTNFGAKRDEMEKAGLSVGLMYGNGGGSAASTAGGTATQPNAPKTNPVEVALQQESMGLQLKQIEAQNRLANAETAKTLACDSLSLIWLAKLANWRPISCPFSFISTLLSVG